MAARHTADKTLVLPVITPSPQPSLPPFVRSLQHYPKQRGDLSSLPATLTAIREVTKQQPATRRDSIAESDNKDHPLIASGPRTVTIAVRRLLLHSEGVLPRRL